jgi:hypothetical protein
LAKVKKPPFARGRRLCIFCGEPANSREHIFAEWLHPYLPKNDEQNHASRFIVMDRDQDVVTDKRRSGEGHSGRLKVVCADCNTGWMSRLQNQTKPFLLPMVRGKQIPLFIRQQQLLSAWATMFVMVVEQRENDSRVVACSQEERTSFMETRRTPATWKVWVGHYTRELWVPIIVHTTAQVVPSLAEEFAYIPQNGVPIVPNTHATTFVVGELFFHVFGSGLPGVVRKQEIAPDAMPRIWPFRSSPVWFPPKIKLTDRDADEIANAFGQRLRRIRAASQV